MSVAILPLLCILNEVSALPQEHDSTVELFARPMVPSDFESILESVKSRNRRSDHGEDLNVAFSSCPAALRAPRFESLNPTSMANAVHLLETIAGDFSLVN